MNQTAWRSVLTGGQRVSNLSHRVGFFLCAFVAAGIMSGGIMAPAIQAGTVVRFDFNYSVDGNNGSIGYYDVELYDTAAPITVANFVRYVNNGLYNNTIIHRNVQDFIMQGGGYSPLFEDGYVTDLLPITTYAPIKNEFSSSRSNLIGTVAMAKLGNDPDSATSQWFVNLGDNSSNLDAQNGGFTVFGNVIGDGMTLIDGINNLQTQDYGGAFENLPMFDDSKLVTVTGASVISKPTGQLSGSVYVDMNKNGIMDGTDYAIANAKVSVTMDGRDTPSATVYSGSDGSYNFTNLGSGTYSVKMEAPNSLPGQDFGAGRMVIDKDGNILSVGPMGPVQENAYNDVWLGDAQTGVNFNFAQDAYPVTLLSARSLLNSSSGIPQTNAIAIPDISIGDSIPVLVGKHGNTTLTVTNVGSEGSALSGVFPEASDEFGSAGESAYGPLDLGQKASREYTYTPSVRGESSQDITITSNAGNTIVTLSGKGVAPVSSLPSGVTGYALVEREGVVSATIKNIGDGNLSELDDESNLKGSIPDSSGDFTGPGGSINLEDDAEQTFDYAFTPTIRGENFTTTISANFTNGSQDGTNAAHTLDVTISGTGVAPVSSLPSEVTGYALVGREGVVNVTIQNIGDGNLSGLGDESNLKGSILDSSGDFTGPGGSINFEDGESESFGYAFTPTIRGNNSTIISASFTNGSQDGINAAHTLDVTITGTGVAPIQSVDSSAINVGLVRIGSTGTAHVTINNIGDGNLSGLGEVSNLNGAVGAGSGNFSGSGGSFSLFDNTEQTFSFTYTPTASILDSTTIALDFTNGSADGMNFDETVNVDITGQGVGPVFYSDLDPDSTMDFGTVPQADLKSLFLEISNLSTDPYGSDTTLTDMTILSAMITGTDAELFSVEGFTPGVVLHGGENLSLEIAYNGTGEHGDRTAVLTIITDEGAVYGMTGNGFVYQIQASLAPEPSSLVLMTIAGLILGGLAWRRRDGKKD